MFIDKYAVIMVTVLMYIFIQSILNHFCTFAWKRFCMNDNCWHLLAKNTIFRVNTYFIQKVNIWVNLILFSNNTTFVAYMKTNLAQLTLTALSNHLLEGSSMNTLRYPSHDGFGLGTRASNTVTFKDKLYSHEQLLLIPKE